MVRYLDRQITERKKVARKQSSSQNLVAKSIRHRFYSSFEGFGKCVELVCNISLVYRGLYRALLIYVHGLGTATLLAFVLRNNAGQIVYFHLTKPVLKEHND